MNPSSEQQAKFREHIGEHVDKWPATKQDLVSACNDLSDFSSDEKAWFTSNLPDRTYNNPDEVKSALRL